MNAHTDILFIGIGNRYRSDDSVGVLIAQRLKEQLRAGARILELSGEGTALMNAWQSEKAVIVFDATRSGTDIPGTIHKFDIQKRSIPAIFSGFSSHAFGLAEAIEMARVLNQLPPEFTVFGIEGKHFGPGETLSAEVALAAEQVVAAIRTYLTQDCFESVLSKQGHSKLTPISVPTLKI